MSAADCHRSFLQGPSHEKDLCGQSHPYGSGIHKHLPAAWDCLVSHAVRHECKGQLSFTRNLLFLISLILKKIVSCPVPR